LTKCKIDCQVIEMFYLSESKLWMNIPKDIFKSSSNIITSWERRFKSLRFIRIQVSMCIKANSIVSCAKDTILPECWRGSNIYLMKIWDSLRKYTWRESKGESGSDFGSNRLWKEDCWALDIIWFIVIKFLIWVFHIGIWKNILLWNEK